MAGLCPVHGPFDGASCPYPPPHTQDGSYRPVPPAPLSDDDMVTDLRGGGSYGQETAPTLPPGSFDEGEDKTQAPRRAKRGILDIDEEEETEVGRARREDVTELEAPVTVPLGILWVKDGLHRGRYYPIRHGTLVGRKEGDLILDDPKVSGSHAKFTMEDDQFTIWDFGSSNGTYVNGKKIREATLLEENDLIKIGDTIFVLKLLESKPKRRTSRSGENSKRASSARKTAKN